MDRRCAAASATYVVRWSAGNEIPGWQVVAWVAMLTASTLIADIALRSATGALRERSRRRMTLS